jgi:hypothetical protein
MLFLFTVLDFLSYSLSFYKYKLIAEDVLML